MGEFRTARGETAAPYPGIGSLSTKTFPNSSLDHKKLIHHDLKYQVVGQDVSPLPTQARDGAHFIPALDHCQEKQFRIAAWTIKISRGSCAGCMWLPQRRRESRRKQTCNLHSPGRGEEETGALWAGAIWAIVPARRPRFREARGVNCAPSGFGLMKSKIFVG